MVGWERKRGQVGGWALAFLPPWKYQLGGGQGGGGSGKGLP